MNLLEPSERKISSKYISLSRDPFEPRRLARRFLDQKHYLWMSPLLFLARKRIKV